MTESRMDPLHAVSIPIVTSKALRSPENAIFIFNLYRFCLAGLLCLLVQVNTAYPALGQYHPGLFLSSLIAFLCFATLSLLTTSYQLKALRWSVGTQVIVDIVLLILMMHASSLRNGFGIFICTSIAGGSLLLSGRIAYGFALIATIGVVIEELYEQGMNLSVGPNFTEVGLLTAAFFSTALVSYELSRRVQASIALAKQRQGALRQLAELNSQIISRMHAGAIVIGENESIALVNESAKQLFHLTTMPRQLSQVNTELQQQYQHWREASLKPQTVIVTVDHDEFEVQFVPLNIEHQHQTLVILEDLLRARQQAQQMKLASLGKFTASIAHEIRNPIGAISHAAQLLVESTDLGDEEQRLTHIIAKQTERVNRMIKNVLQLSRREASQAQWMLLHPWLRDFGQQIIVTGVEKPEISIDCPCEQWVVYIDASQLHQILMNLCSNGLRYSMQHTQRPTLTLRVHESDDALVLDVIDQGEGVKPHDMGRLFEPFHTTEPTGTGLGLYLAKELCDLNRARLRYCNEGSGGCFSIAFSQYKRGNDGES